MFIDLLIHAIVSKKTLSDTMSLLKKNFDVVPNTEFNTQMIEMIASEEITLQLLDNDFALGIWVYLLPTYRIHLNDNTSKTTSVSINLEVFKGLLKCQELKADTWNTRLSRARNQINSLLPKGTIMVTKVINDDISLMFMTADNLEDAHKLVIEHFEGVSTIDKLLASFGVLSV